MMARDPNLHRRINENLRKVYDGTYKREAALARARDRREKEYKKQRRRELLDDRKELKQKIATLTHERDQLQRDYQWLYDKHNAGTLSRNYDGIDEFGALEEIDHRITDILGEEIVKTMDQLEYVEDMLR
jgi:hypothetical protein